MREKIIKKDRQPYTFQTKVHKVFFKSILLLTIFSIVLASALPVTSITTSNEKTKNEKILDFTKNTITVDITRLSRFGTFLHTREEWSPEKLNEISVRFNACQSPEEGFQVLQEYGFIPKNMNMAICHKIVNLRLLSEKYQSNTNIQSLLKNRDTCGCEQTENSKESLGHGSVSDVFCLVTAGHIHPPFSVLYMPMIFYSIYAEYGGGGTFTCPNYPQLIIDTDSLFTLDIIGWIGVFIPHMTNMVCLWPVSYFGLAFLLDASG